jgi:hypothetical protein
LLTSNKEGKILRPLWELRCLWCLGTFRVVFD